MIFLSLEAAPHLLNPSPRVHFTLQALLGTYSTRSPVPLVHESKFLVTPRSYIIPLANIDIYLNVVASCILYYIIYP